MLDQRHRATVDDVDRAPLVPREHRVTHGLGPQPLPLEPDACARVQPGFDARLSRAQLALQKFREQRVIAEPVSLLVERLNEQLSPLDVGNCRRSVGNAGHVLDKLRAEPPEHRRANKELLCRIGLLFERLLREIVAQHARFTGESADQRVQVFLAAECDEHHLQGGRPAFGQRLQLRDIALRQIDGKRPAYEGGRLVPGKAQRFRSELGHAAFSAQFRQTQAGQAARGNRDIEVGGRVRDQM